MKTFKHWSILMLMMMTMPMMVACGGDDDNDNTSIDINEAIGTWMCVQSSDTYEGYTSEGLMIGKRVTILRNGTYTSTAPSFGYNGTYTLNGNHITAKSNAGTFVINANITGYRMTWTGTSSEGVSFRYIFERVDDDDTNSVAPPSSH